MQKPGELKKPAQTGALRKDKGFDRMDCACGWRGPAADYEAHLQRCPKAAR